MKICHVHVMKWRKMNKLAGRWDDSEEKTLASALKRSKYFDAEEVIDKVAKEGIEMNKLPEHFILGEIAKADLIAICENKINRLDGLNSITDTIMAYLKGYSEGKEEGIKVIDL